MTMNKDEQLQIFISYSHTDDHAAQELRRLLDLAGFSIWQDITSLRGGQHWDAQISEAIKAMDVMVVIMTPSSTTPDSYVAEEIQLTRHEKKQFIPLLWQSCTVPPAWQAVQYHDLTHDFTGGLMKLLRDLVELQVEKVQRLRSSGEAPTGKSGTGDHYVVNQTAKTVTGDMNGLVFKRK